MEPVDPGKNVEGTGCSKRRISSILKAPRKSLLLRDSEQQENEVETAKLVEKRNSRRVSFAPANDVLLFAKEAKNASPVRNPLQELMGAATATTQNRVQMVTAEDTSPQIMGIDSLLNAPLHSSQQGILVHLESGIGENTVVFSTEDAEMDLTHSHTININCDIDLLEEPDHQNYDPLLSGGGNVADVFTELPPSHFVQATNQASALLLDKKTDSSVETRTVSATPPLLDPDFKDFLSSLSKPSPSSTGMTPLTSDDIKSSLAADVDKENQMPKSLSSSRNIGESLNGSGFRRDDEVSMEVTEAQTGRILGADNDDPFQCLFPTQEMYEKSERKSRARETKQQQSCESLESNDQKANKTLTNLSVHTPLESHKVCSGLKNDFREKTVVFAADEFMDITQNLTGSVAGADRSLLQHKIPTNDVDLENYPPSTNWVGVDPAAPVKPGGDFSMDTTEVQRSDDVFQFLIPSEEMHPLCKSQKKEIFNVGQQDIDRPQSSDHKGLKTSKLNMEPQRHQLMDKVAAPDDQREKTLRFSAGDDCLDESHTVHISTNVKLNPLQNVNVAPSCEEKSIRFYADDVTMDITQCLTTNIATDLASDKFSSLLGLSTRNHCDASTTMAATSGPSDGFTVYLEDNMDMTETQTGCILEAEVSEEMLHKHESLQAVLPTKDTQRQSVHGKTERNLHQQHKEGFGASDYTETSTKNSLKTIIQRNQVEFGSTDDCREKTVRFDAAEVCMDVTRCNTMDISSDLPLPNQISAANGEKTVRFDANDAEMDVTKSHTVNILRDLPLQSFIDVALPANGEKTVRFNANDAAMDITRSHTADIAHHLNVLEHKEEVLLSAEGERTQTFDASDAEMDVTRCHTVNIMRDLPLQSFPNLTVPSHREKTLRFSAKDAEMDVTKSHTVNIMTDFPNLTIPSNGEKTERFSSTEADMDVTKSHTVKIFTDLKMLLNQNENLLPAGGEKTVRFNANDAAMDITKSHTVNIVHDLDLLPHQNLDAFPADGERTVRFGVKDEEMESTKSLAGKVLLDSNVLSDQIISPPPTKEKNLTWLAANDVSMNVTKSHTVNIMTDFPNLTIPSNGEKTERFSSTEADMDVTKSHTVKIFTDLKMLLNQNENLLPAGGEKTMRFNANDAAMDITKSHTVNIVHDLDLLPHQNLDALPADGERTVRFGVKDEEMDVTKSHTVNIRRDLSLRSFPDLTIASNGEKTVRFSANDAAMDITKSHTVNIVHDLDLLPHQNVDALPADGERTVRFGVKDEEMESTKSLTGKVLLDSNVLSDQIISPPPTKEKNLAWLAANDVTVDVTRSHTVSIVTDFNQAPSQITDSSPTGTERVSNTFVDETGSDTKSISKNYKLALRHNVKLLPKSGEKTTEFTTNNATMNIVNNPLLQPVMSDQNSENMNDTLAKKETDSGNRGLDSNPPSSTQSDLFQTSCAQDEANRNTPSCPDSSYSQCKAKEPDTDPENESSSLGSDVGKPINKTKTNTEEICASVDQTEPLGSSTDDPPQGFSSKQNPHSKSFMESVSDVYRPEAETQAVSQKMESSPSKADQNGDVLSSRMSRRKSLADLQSKVKRLSQLINAAPDPAAMETCTASLLHLDPNVEKNTNHAEAEQLSVATSSTPFNLKTKQLMSRLSVGGFKPKLPKRNTADELNKSAVKEATKTFTVSVPSQPSQFDKITDIHDEELVDCEDFSETIDTMTPEKFSEKDNSSNQFSTFQEEDFVYMDDFTSSSQRQKRSLPENEDEEEQAEKRKKIHTEFMSASQSDVDYESKMAAACAQTIDSPSNTVSRCEIASESTFKHSLFESQLEDYGSDGQKKLEDGTITVLEFFNLFSIDFVIHNPRQSVLPGRLLDNSDATALDLLKDKHISRPKQSVYEADVKTLTEKVEGLKYRMQDLGKPLKTVNRALWEEVNHFTEKELKSFGAKLKERNNLFRKNSKVQSHEMKEELYANLVRVNLEEQQKLRATISQADEMIQTLDGCISDLEAELDGVVESGSEDKLSIKSLQEEMSKVTESLADHERQTSELDLEKKKNSSELTKLKAEERKLENYIDTLNMLNEWRLEEKDDRKENCSVFTFLHKTLFLRLVFEKTNGNNADRKSERKITNISFKFNLSDEKAQCHARLVHKLVSQFIEGESGWVEKYPTSGHVPKLLHDVSLVVSRCRLVGEELRLLKMWGNLRFDILHISCSQTQIHIVFSSLKKLSKFEVVFGVMLTDQICVFHVQSFKNLIGNTTIHQIEEVVASLSPGRNLFTRIIKKLHETFLS